MDHSGRQKYRKYSVKTTYDSVIKWILLDLSNFMQMRGFETIWINDRLNATVTSTTHNNKFVLYILDKRVRCRWCWVVWIFTLICTSHNPSASNPPTQTNSYTHNRWISHLEQPFIHASTIWRSWLIDGQTIYENYTYSYSITYCSVHCKY